MTKNKVRLLVGICVVVGLAGTLAWLNAHHSLLGQGGGAVASLKTPTPNAVGVSTQPSPSPQPSPATGETASAATASSTAAAPATAIAAAPTPNQPGAVTAAAATVPLMSATGTVISCKGKTTTLRQSDGTTLGISLDEAGFKCISYIGRKVTVDYRTIEGVNVATQVVSYGNAVDYGAATTH